MKFEVSDPLFLLAAQSGLSADSPAPSSADANQKLQGELKALQLGEPIPLVFTRRKTVGTVSYGGVFIVPKASEGRFTNVPNPNNALSFAYLLVLSEGDLPLVRIKDIFQRTCRVGDTFNQAYAARAGTWTPANTIAVSTSRPHNWDAPNFVGTGGSYENLTTLSFEGSTAPVDESWKRQIFVYIREGMKVTRLVDSTLGSSDNFADLAKYLITQSGMVAADLIDDTGLQSAANFTNTNNFLFNGVLTAPENLRDWLEKTAFNFLLRLSINNGKFSLRPRLPMNTDYSIKTTAITPEFTFTEDAILPDGFEISYIPLSDRTPVCNVMLWRQQQDNEFGFARTIQVRYQGEAANGPFVQYDLSNYCTSENHAVKVAAYRLAQRKLVSHTLRITVRARSYASTLTVGDIVQVKLRRETAIDDVSFHNHLYEIERINKTSLGQIVYDLIHFPVNASNQSLTALAVSSAVGAGNQIESGKSTFSCDVNTGTGTVGEDNQPPINPPPIEDTDLVLPPPLPPSPPSNQPQIPDDPLNESLDDPTVITPSSTPPVVGGTVSVPSSALPCSDGRVCFYRIDKATGIRTLRNCVTQPIAGNYSMTITTADIDYTLQAIGQCKDPGSPSGFGEEIDFGSTSDSAEPDLSQYTQWRWTGSRQGGTAGIEYGSSGWNNYEYGANYASISGMYFCTILTVYAIQPGSYDTGPGAYYDKVPVVDVPWRASISVTTTADFQYRNHRVGSLNSPCNDFPVLSLQNASTTYTVTGYFEFSDGSNTPLDDIKWGGRS